MFISNQELESSYDLIVAGSSFASGFFLEQYLLRAPASARVLVVEQGEVRDHAWRVKNRRNSPIDHNTTFDYAGTDSHKWWTFTIGFGGSSNCWSGNTPRMLPSDMELRSRYGVGVDWPISYADLEPYYAQVEARMFVAGPGAQGPSMRLTNFPLPPHRLSDAQLALQRAHPGKFLAMPSARATTAAAGRGVCCNSGVCRLCPVDAKFTVDNGLMAAFGDPRVAVLTSTEAWAVDRTGGAVTGLVIKQDEVLQTVKSDAVALGANALFNPAILLRSGFEHPRLGTRLHEQMSVRGEVFFDGLKGFNGGTSVNGIGYMGWDGDHRKSAGACMLEAWNVGPLRPEHGRWMEVMKFVLVVEDLPLEENRVRVSADGRTLAEFNGHGQYGYAGLERAKAKVAEWFAPLPVERIAIDPEIRRTESHIQGTTMMGLDPATSVLDGDQRMHGHDNLYVLGSGSFPTCSPANPTLTLAALAARSGRRMQA